MSSRIVAALLALIVAGAGVFVWVRSDDQTPSEKLADEARILPSNDWLERACALPRDELVRLWRGHDPVHSEDITTVPLRPNYSGSFAVTSHSGPWDYLQNVPLVLYGPGQIDNIGPVQDPASVADIYPTVGQITGVPLPARDGKPLRDAIEDDNVTPKLIVLVVWDGVGRNVLTRWQGKWPNLERFERDGASFLEATVGSAPSITPATHATMGTGSFPVDHGVTAIEFRDKGGAVRGVFPGRDPSDLELSTYADEIDLALDNEPLVGLLAWKSWHMGMLGHGTQFPGGDADQLALIGSDRRITGNDDFYSTPEYLVEFPGLEERAAELDLSDGKADGEWRGRDPLEQHDNRAWVEWQTDALLAMLEREGYGTDEVTDLFFTNYKPSDIVSHQHNIDSPEMREALEAQDAALGRLVDFLDEEVGDYVVIVTSDHGNTPPPERSGAWPLLQGQLEEDIDTNFKVPDDTSLVRQTSAAGPFIRKDVAADLGVTMSDIAEFLNDYTIGDNFPEEELPEGYEDRADENVLAAAFPSDRIGTVLECALGTRRPPRSFKA